MLGTTHKNDVVFAFDLGTGSIGECVRQGSDILHLDSLIIPAEFASTKDQAKKRRMVRTRIAHKAREKWWLEQARAAEIEVLESRQPNQKEPINKPDDRLLREFPQEGDSTIYTSCLLRIALVQGVKLEGWQVYKAIRSAIQRRGYDSSIPWKNNDSDRSENEQLSNVYVEYCRNNFGEHHKEYWLPCYVDAHKIGMWSPDNPLDLNQKRENETNPNPARNKNHVPKMVAPRAYVENELNSLLF
jgi:CRISPR-associated endonuclease Csn1